MRKLGFSQISSFFPSLSCPGRVQCYCPELCCRKSELGTSTQPATVAPHHLSPALVLPAGWRCWHCLHSLQHPDPSPTPRYPFSLITALPGWRARSLRGKNPLGIQVVMSHWSSSSTSMSWVAMEEQEVGLCRVRTAMLEVSKEMQIAR